MTPKSHKKLRGLAMKYQYKMDTNTVNTLRAVTTSDLHLVRKINHEIFNIQQWMPPNVKIDIMPQLGASNLILRMLLATAPDATVSLTSAMLYLRKQLKNQKLVGIISNCPFRM